MGGGTSEGSCSLYAEAEGARVTVTNDGLLEGEMVVPRGGVCRQSHPLQLADIAPGDYHLAYGCTPCFIGELSVFETALTPQSRLRGDGVGPLRIGMTLEEAQQAAGTPLDTAALEGCVELVPADPAINIGLSSHDGRTLDVISGGSNSALATRAGIRAGSPVKRWSRRTPNSCATPAKGRFSWSEPVLAWLWRSTSWPARSGTSSRGSSSESSTARTAREKARRLAAAGWPPLGISAGDAVTGGRWSGDGEAGAVSASVAADRSTRSHLIVRTRYPAPSQNCQRRSVPEPDPAARMSGACIHPATNASSSSATRKASSKVRSDAGE